jgi:transcriptional regulator with XRE-family HTH domain
VKQLKDFRELTGMSPELFAKDLGVSLSLYEKIEYGYITPSKSFIKKFKTKYPIIDTNIFFTK